MKQENGGTLHAALAAAQQEIQQLRAQVESARRDYQAILESNGDSIFIVNTAHDTIIDANTHAIRRLGYTRESLIGLPMQDIEVPTNELEDSLAWESETSGTQVYECYHRHKSGTLIPVEVSSRIITLGNHEVQHIAARCVAHRKARDEERERIRAQLHESLELFETFISQSNDGIIIVDHEGHIVEWNSAASGITGLQTEDILGRSVLDVIDTVLSRKETTEHIEGMALLLQHVLMGGDTPWFGRPIEQSIHHLDGTKRTVLGIAFPVDTSTGRRLGCIIRDITARKQALAREFALELEKERRDLLSSFIQHAAHEFRTPMTTISTNAYIMSRLSQNNPAIHERSNQIQLQIKRMTRLLDILLMMVKLNASDTSERAATQLNTLLNEVCQSVQSAYGLQPTLRLVQAETHLTVNANADDLHAAFTQILDNAFRYTPMEGTIQVLVTYKADTVEVSIQDTGTGISADDLPQVFQSFWRQDKAHSTPGFGLGLTIAQTVIQQHDGHIHITSEVAQGTTVTVRLPRA